MPRSRGIDRSRWLQTCPNQEERNSNDKNKSGRGERGREEREREFRKRSRAETVETGKIKRYRKCESEEERETGNITTEASSVEAQLPCRPPASKYCSPL